MAATQVFAIPELLEIILSHLPVHEIIRSQRVCHHFRSIVESSPLLREVCWYSPSNKVHTAHPKHPWTINPIFEHLGMKFCNRYYHTHRYVQGDNDDPAKDFQACEFNLRKLIYEAPGSWCGMLAFQPPAKYLEFQCYGDYSADENMSYYVEAQSNEGLRVSDVMAVLAEAQNRQARGVDRWAGVQHYSGEFWPEEDPRNEHTGGYWDDPMNIFKTMPNDVDLKVTVSQAWGSGDFPAFSLKRLRPAMGKPVKATDGKDWKYELIMHEMIWPPGGELYRWEWGRYGGHTRPAYLLDPVYKNQEGKYEAKLLRVKEHSEGYLEACKDVYKLIEAEEVTT